MALAAPSIPDPLEAPECGSGPHAWYGPDQYGSAFGAGKLGRKRRLGWIESLPDDQRRLCPDGWRVRGDALLPDDKAGQRPLDGRRTVEEHCQDASVFRPPANWRTYTEAQRRTWRGWVGRELRFRAYCRTHPSQPPSAAETYLEFGRVYASWLAAHKLTAGRSEMYTARKRLEARSEVPRRGAPKGSGAAKWHPRAEAWLGELLFRSQAEPAEIHRTLRALGAKENFPAPSYSQVLQRIRAHPKGAVVLARKGERALDCMSPKGVRPRKALRGWWSLDCRTEDVYVQVPSTGGALRRTRATCAGIYAPYHDQWIDLRFDVTENAELVASGVRAGSHKHGLARVIQVDCGSAYMFLSDDGPLGGFLTQFGTRLVRAEAYRAYQKRIEGRWNSLKDEVDRYALSFCGGSPGERPEDLEAWSAAHVAELPTIEQLNAWAQVFIETHNATPREHLGGLTPNVHAQLYGPAKRIVDPDVASFWFTPLLKEHGRPAERVCDENGVTIARILYRPAPEDVARLQGRKVLVRLDDELADRVVLCDAGGAPICYAYAEKLVGTRREHAREARRRRERYKRAIRSYIPARDDSLDSETGRILRVKRDHALAEERRLRAKLGDVPERPVRIIRADLVESAKALKARQRARDAIRGTTAAAATATDGGRVDGFEALARVQDERRPVSPAACSWEEYPEHEYPEGAPVQEARSAFDQLADVG